MKVRITRKVSTQKITVGSCFEERKISKQGCSSRQAAFLSCAILSNRALHIILSEVIFQEKRLTLEGWYVLQIL